MIFLSTYDFIMLFDQNHSSFIAGVDNNYDDDDGDDDDDWYDDYDGDDDDDDDDDDDVDNYNITIIYFNLP